MILSLEKKNKGFMGRPHRSGGEEGVLVSLGYITIYVRMHQNKCRLTGKHVEGNV